jgi:Pyruvate/2-oxoacid:ferredoxin oxidoreductase gamma subunit
MIVTNVLLLGICVWLINISLDLSRIARAIERLKKEGGEKE